jgi:hypothetical protein
MDHHEKELMSEPVPEMGRESGTIEINKGNGEIETMMVHSFLSITMGERMRMGEGFVHKYNRTKSPAGIGGCGILYGEMGKIINTMRDYVTRNETGDIIMYSFTLRWLHNGEHFYLVAVMEDDEYKKKYNSRKLHDDEKLLSVQCIRAKNVDEWVTITQKIVDYYDQIPAKQNNKFDINDIATKLGLALITSDIKIEI